MWGGAKEDCCPIIEGVHEIDDAWISGTDLSELRERGEGGNTLQVSRKWNMSGVKRIVGQTKQGHLIWQGGQHNAASVKHISGKEGMLVPVESPSKPAISRQKKALVTVRQAEADWAQEWRRPSHWAGDASLVVPDGIRRQTGDCKQKLLHSGVRFQLSQFMQRFTNPGDWSTSFLDILGSEKWHTFESNYVCPFLQPVRRQRCFFTLGEVVLLFPPGSPWGTFIAARSAPDPTLDMDRRVGNFLLVE